MSKFKIYIIVFLATMLMIMMLPTFFGASNAETNQISNANQKLSAEVLAYQSIVEELSKEYEMEDFAYLLLCLMQVESGGRGLDPMQASEGPFNTKYPKYPNGITDPEYSLRCGIQELKSVLNKANVKSPDDYNRIKVALAGYNFGSGYIDWVNLRGGEWTLENAQEFSNMMAIKMGWSAYGDPPYANKVMKYYMSDGDSGASQAAMGEEAYKKLIKEAEKYLGYPYVFGGSTPATSFDCSGFICWVFTQSGIYYLPRTTAQGIYNQCERINEADAKPGDLIFFTGTYDCPEPVSHIGIYVGNGKMLHCGDPIGYEVIGDYWQSHFYAYGRLKGE